MVYSLVQILSIRSIFKHVSDLEIAVNQISRAEFSLNVVYSYLRKEIVGETAEIIQSQLKFSDFMVGEDFYDFTSFYKIEDESILEVDSTFYQIQDEFLMTKVCSQKSLNFICSKDVTGFNTKDSLFL
jgi:hypothetical protein